MSAPPEPPFKVIIIGAGLAGSLLANGLLHNGVNVSVYERLPRHSEREGYQIRLGAPALIGMRACLTAQQIADITAKFGRAGGARAGAPMICNKHFDTLLDLSVFPTYNKTAPIGRGILRDALADPLFDVGKMQYGRRFSHYGIVDSGTPDERVRVFFEDGLWEDAHLLIGADGSHSMVNTQLGLNNIFQIDKHLNFISKNELPVREFLKMDPNVRGQPVMTMADGKGLFFCAYLPDKIDATDYVRRGKEIDETISSSMLGCQIPADDCPEDLINWSNERKWDFLSEQLSDWSSQYHDIINLQRGAEIYVFRGRSSVRPDANWRSKAQTIGPIEHGHSRVWLLGDAMHAMLPSRGMGANQSLRDAATIVPLVSKLSQAASEGQIPSTVAIANALKEYEDEMIPRAFEWVSKSSDQSLLVGDTSTWRGYIQLKAMGVLMNIAHAWILVKGIFFEEAFVDDAPELRE